jgi:hypothetical protein
MVVEESLWNQRWGGVVLARGARYLQPADGLCDQWLGAITV